MTKLLPRLETVTRWLAGLGNQSRPIRFETRVQVLGQSSRPIAQTGERGNSCSGPRIVAAIAMISEAACITVTVRLVLGAGSSPGPGGPMTG